VYDIRKKLDMIGAIAFKSPEKLQKNQIIYQTNVTSA
jgi:hypothetical protein